MSDIPDIEQRLRAFATSPPDAMDWEDVLRRAGGRRTTEHVSRRRLKLALAAVVVMAGAAAGAFIANETGSGPRGSTGTNGAEAPPNTLSLTYTRNAGALESIGVTASPEASSAGAVVDVFGGPRGGPTVLVYQQQVPLTPPAGGSPEQRPTWTGTLSPSDWSGGCQAGWDYTVDVLTPAPGTSLAEVMAEPPAQLGRDGNVEIDGARVLSSC